MAKFFHWARTMEDLADARDPDLLVTASNGWSFRTDGELGTDHGGPLPESMRMSCFMAGPNIRHGVVRQPHRIIDIVPTILEMIGFDDSPGSFDGQPVRGIYE